MNLKLDQILNLPTSQKLALVASIFILIGAGFFYGLYQPKMKELTSLRAKQTELSNKLQEDKRIADNLPRFKRDFEQLNLDLANALTELPNQKEIPSLLTSITSRGKEAGLDFLVFRPKAEEPKDFYSAVPLDIVISGSFYNVANFFIEVGNLPRIVNISNVNVSELRNAGGRMLMKVSCLATTFRFLEKKETKDDKKPKK
jgi:type IV pilus assembly protein PilO